jgi:hypothetical protein
MQKHGLTLCDEEVASAVRFCEEVEALEKLEFSGDWNC